MKLTSAIIASLLVASPIFAATFEVNSSDLKANAPMSAQHEFNSFGCTGGNISPHLSWKNAPAGTKSFAITVFDPDAPTGSGWWHWTVVNIPGNINSLNQGSVPATALETRTDFGKPGYGGACPPQGDKPHRYVHTVWALNVEQLPNVDANSSGALVGFMLNQHKLAKAKITTTYQRKK